MADSTKMWMPVFIGDLLADTLHLTVAEFGAYHLMLYHQWRNGPIPDRSLQAVTRLTDSQWADSVATLKAFMKQDENGCWYQARAKQEKEKAEHNSVTSKTNGAKGGRPKKNPDLNLNGTQSVTQPEPKPEPKQKLNETPSPSPIPFKVQEQILSSPSEPHPNATPSGSEPDPPNVEKLRLIAGKPAAHRAMVQRVFDTYVTTLRRDPKKYTLTDERVRKALLRIDERLRHNAGDLAAVEAEFIQAVKNLAASDYHQSGGYIDWTDHIFKSSEIFEKRLNWRKVGPGLPVTAMPNPLEEIRAQRATAEAELEHR